MGLIILIFPYLLTMLSRFNKDKILAWRKFFVIVSICYLPFIGILAGVYAYQLHYLQDTTDPLFLYVDGNLFKKLFNCYYFGYFLLTVLFKKKMNIQLSWWIYITFGMLYYFITTTFLDGLFYFCKDPLICINPPLIHYIMK